MRPFQLIGLDPEQFGQLFDLSDSDLKARNIRRVRADADFGFPCRICLEDAQPGDELLLLPFQHQPAASPYQASWPIFVRKGSLLFLLTLSLQPRQWNRPPSPMTRPMPTGAPWKIACTPNSVLGNPRYAAASV